MIALHDLLATTAALFAALYIRFEGGGDFYDSLPLLFQILLRKWIAALDQAIARDDRATIRTILKDAVPEFGSTAA